METLPKPPTFCKGLRGPRGRPDPKNDRFPILKKFQNLLTKPKCSHEYWNGRDIEEEFMCFDDVDGML